MTRPCIVLMALLFLTCAAFGFSPRTLESTTESGVHVECRGMLHEVEYWPSMYSTAERRAADVGGMQMIRYMREHKADWLLFDVLAPEEGARWNGDTVFVLEFEDGRRIESQELLLADSPLELKVFLASDGISLTREGGLYGRVGSGANLVAVSFPSGSVDQTGEFMEHNAWWAEFELPAGVTVKENGTDTPIPVASSY